VATGLFTTTEADPSAEADAIMASIWERISRRVSIMVGILCLRVLSCIIGTRGANQLVINNFNFIGGIRVLKKIPKIEIEPQISSISISETLNFSRHPIKLKTL
jgi:hypothetical protein